MVCSVNQYFTELNILKHFKNVVQYFGLVVQNDYLCTTFVCHDDEMTLGSGSFSGISQQLPKRW